MALRRCLDPWKSKHILSALALLTIPLLLALMNKGGSMDHQQRFDVPLTYQQASSEAEIDFPLPSSSHHINYAAYADWQVAGMFVRFEAPPGDCLSHVETVKAWFNTKHDRRIIWKKDEINTSSPPIAALRETRLGSLAWFDVHRIRNGIHLHSPSNPNSPQIWIDLKSQVFYYWWTK